MPKTTARMRADEHVEKIVDARPAAAQAVETLELKPERHERRDEREPTMRYC